MFTRGVLVGLVTGVTCCTAGFAGYQFATQEEQHHPVVPQGLHGANIEYEDIQSKKNVVSRILKYGVPQQSANVSVYRNHALRYDQERRIPRWVAEAITYQHVHGPANRRTSKFSPDPSIPELFSSQNVDFWNSGWSRGHMAPAGNNKHDQEAMNDTFLLTNVLPQDIDNNAGFWNRLEMFCRDLTKKYKDVYIISGPLFLPCTEQTPDGKTKKFIKYEVLGSSEVAVPTHLFKVITVEKGEDRTPCVGAFVVPNEPIPKDRNLSEFQVPLEFVESKSGHRLMPLLDRSRTSDLCETKEDCQLISWDKFELYFINRKLEGARTVHRLDRVWGEIDRKGLTPDDGMIEAYRMKRKELEDKEGKSGSKDGAKKEL